MRRAGALAVVLCARAAAAGPHLTLDHEPAPPQLHMRWGDAHRRAAQLGTTGPAPAPAPAPASPDAMPAAPPVKGPLDTPGDTIVRDVREPVSVRFSLGFQTDGTTLTGQPNLAGRIPPTASHTNRPDFDLLHAYGFGEAYLSTRGVGMESLSTYFASHFQLAQQDLVHDPHNPLANPDGNVAIQQPIATWFDRTGVETYNVWAEVKDFLGTPALAPLRVRAGEQYVYGPWVLHMYGVVAAWDGKLISGTVYGGSRVPDYTLAVADQELDRAGIAGTSVKIDLRQLRRPLPFTISAEGLAFTHLGAGQTQASNHGELEVDWLPREGFALIGQARTLDGAPANEHVQFRARYHQVTNIVIDVTHHHADDWRWDPSLVGEPATDPLAAKRYLDLGPVVPQVLISARAGTLIAENVDLYARVAMSRDLRDNPATDSSFAASYLEGGGALEIRLRRTLSLGLSGLTRRTDRGDSLAQRIEDLAGSPQPLPLAAQMGERSFVEAGASLRMNLGARKFSALVEVYGRNTQYARAYCLPGDCVTNAMTGIPTSDTRGGGRFTFDAWIGKRVRMYASYELSTGLPLFPEMTGYKSLRLMMEGVY